MILPKPERRKTTKHTLSKCQFCSDEGLSPSEAIACAMHSIIHVRELKAEISVLRNEAGTSSKLHLALADLDGSVPSTDGRSELESVKDTRRRLGCVSQLLEMLVAKAGFDDDEADRLARQFLQRKNRR